MYFFGYYCEVVFVFVGVGCFYGGVKCEDIGLEGDVVDGVDNYCYFFWVGGDMVYGVYYLFYYFVIFGYCSGGFVVELIGLVSVFCVLFDGGGDLFYVGGGLL